MSDEERLIKVRDKQKGGRWSFLSRDGSNRLRIHALRFTPERAATLAAEIIANEEANWDAKVVR
jgi:hypothetical protein